MNQPISFSDRVEQHGSSSQSHTLTPQRYFFHERGESCRFQAEPPWKVSVTRGKCGMSLKPSIGRITCEPGLEEARARLFRTCWWTLVGGSELGSCNLYLKLGKARFREPQAQNAGLIPVQQFYSSFTIVNWNIKHCLLLLRAYPIQISSTRVLGVSKTSFPSLVPPPYLLLYYLFLCNHQLTIQWSLHNTLPQTWYLSWQILMILDHS